VLFELLFEIYPDTPDTQSRKKSIGESFFLGVGILSAKFHRFFWDLKPYRNYLNKKYFGTAASGTAANLPKNSSAHDPSKCWENGKWDPDCCGKTDSTSCTDGFMKNPIHKALLPRISLPLETLQIPMRHTKN